MKKKANLTLVTDEIMAEVNAAKNAVLSTEKTAAVQKMKTDIGASLMKLAEVLKQSSTEVTYDDIAEFLKKK